MTDTQTALAQVREALAARPTPGPWSLKTVPTSDGSCHKIGPFPSASRIHSETHACVYAIGIRLGIDDSTPVARELLANARLMAACSPLNMAAILAHVDAQAAEIERLTKSEQIEAQIEARDALLDFISENGTASEGVQHYLDRYVRAALAAKDNGNAGE